MLNERDASELISMSLSGRLSDDQRSVVDQHLADSEKSQAFARLSQVIQDSVSGIGDLAAAGDPSVAPSLSTEAKDRLKGSVASLLAGAADTQDGVGRIANADTPLAAAGSTRQSGGGLGPQTYPTGQASPWPPATANRQLVSRYTLIRKLGEGGLGTVWLARDEKLKRTVAIKEMNAVAAENPKAWQRFHREAEITGLLEHPNVVPLYQFGSDPKSGLPFYAMRFLGKSTLANAIEEFHERRRLGEQDCVGFYRLLSAFVGVCQAIAYAHSRGVIHRDLKPENVALDNFGQVIVLDWGLAKLTHEAESRIPLGQGPAVLDADGSQTLAGEVIGTPLYMAPEQAAGDLEKVDEQTDIYGLGAILFAILTGEAPHQNTKSSSGSDRPIPELLRTIADADTPSARELHSRVPADLDAICRRSMSRHRYARHKSAAELADEVQRWMAGQNAKREQYENMRFEGRDIRTAFVSCLRDLGTNARFMGNLPPIQGIIRTVTDGDEKELAVWRERLSTIFKGLLQANTSFNAVSFVRVDDTNASELVRVERHSTEHATVRRVPLSRLRTAPAPPFYKRAAQQKPDEVYAGMLSDFSGMDVNEGIVCSEGPGYYLASAVPVFDETTEEVFGVVVIEARLNRFVAETMGQRRASSDSMYIFNEDQELIAFWQKDMSVKQPMWGTSGRDLFGDWDKVQEALTAGDDYADTTNREVFATMLRLCGAGDNVVIALKS